MKQNHLCELLDIKYPIIQAGMVWVSGAKLAAASANSGVLGVIGAGSMKPELLDKHLLKVKSLSDKSIAVNLPLLYQDIETQIDLCLKHEIKVFITSAGSPRKFTEKLKSHGAKVIHVISNPLLAKKCEQAGVDAVIAEGFEAGGHNGRDELTTLTLVPQVLNEVKIPVIAAGGIHNGRAILAAMALGASGVQMGTRFMMTKESSAHDNYKKLLLDTNYDSTELVMKTHVPVRLVKNEFYKKVKQLEARCADKNELVALLGKGRAKNGMLNGDLLSGELEAGQICADIKDLPNTNDLVKNLISEYNLALKGLTHI